MRVPALLRNMKGVEMATGKPHMVIAHQFLAAARIIEEQLTALGYDDKWAKREYFRLKKLGYYDQAAVRLFAAAVRAYDDDKQSTAAN